MLEMMVILSVGGGDTDAIIEVEMISVSVSPSP